MKRSLLFITFKKIIKLNWKNSMHALSSYMNGSCCDMGHVGDVGDIADMPIGRNAIIVEDVEDKTLTSK